ncbi:MAG: lytic transglycosylase domain-containing protein [Xanthomonadales bacterium]|nr:lytic transglycosylase domain-containing protein [Xanthomonadales bacterium]
MRFLIPLLLLLPLGGEAQVYRFVDENGVIHYTDQKPRNGQRFKTIRVKCRGCNWNRAVDWKNVALVTDAYGQEILRACDRYGVDESLVRAIIHAESSFKRHALSDAGAQGLMQLMPDTQRRFGVTSPYTPSQNIDAGVRYLRILLDLFDQDIRLASAAYNAGENAVRQYGGIPPYQETRNFVDRVEILRSRYSRALL